MRDDEFFHRWYMTDFCALEVIIINLDTQIVLISSPVDLECLLVSLVRYTIPDFTSNHKLIAVHIIVHSIFKDGHEGFLIHKIEVNYICRCNLNSNITFYEVDESPFFYFVVLNPYLSTREFLFLLPKE